MNTNWYEVWADETLAPPYLLMLEPGPPSFRIIDPQEQGKVCFECESYDKATDWLTEDEYVLVGRKERDD